PSRGDLTSVTPVGGGDWAVGSSGGMGSRQPMILRRTGTTWKRVATPAVGNGALVSVAAASATNAWAVGGLSGGPRLALHWNGRAWKRVTVPSPAGGGILSGVAVTSRTNAWAVGYTGAGKTVILHWGGRRWRQVATPHPAGRYQGLFGV